MSIGPSMGSGLLVIGRAVVRLLAVGGVVLLPRRAAAMSVICGVLLLFCRGAAVSDGGAVGRALRPTLLLRPLVIVLRLDLLLVCFLLLLNSSN
jgi:hypothetical protein